MNHDNFTIRQQVRRITIVNAFQLDDHVLIVVLPAFQLDLLPLTRLLDKPGLIVKMLSASSVEETL